MNKKDRPSQLELFSGSAEIPQNAEERTTIFENRVSFNIEHLVVLSVIVLMFIVFSFSLGVEKGKKIASISGVSNIPATEKRFETIEKGKEKEPQANQLKTDSFKQEVLPEKELDIYTIQVASFKNRNSVEEEAKGLQNKGYEITVLPKGKWIILCVGKFGNRQEAESLQKELRKKYKDCLIREL